MCVCEKYVIRNEVKVGCLDVESFFDLFWSAGYDRWVVKKRCVVEFMGARRGVFFVGGGEKRLGIGCVRIKELCVCENVCNKKCEKF